MRAIREDLAAMDFPERFATLRRQKGLTQQAFADEVEFSLIQLRRYEAGSFQPTLDVIKRLVSSS